MKRVLFVGENPLGTSGNSNMLAAMLSDLDTERFQAACFVVHDVNPSAVLFNPLPFTMVNGTNAADYWGNHRLLSLIQESDFDVLCMAGVDFWRYLPAWKGIKQLRRVKKFKWVGIFPYDTWQVPREWPSYWNDLDFPCVYSQYGFESLSPFAPAIRYFRPRLNGWEGFVRFSERDRIAARKETFPNVADDAFIFGFVGQNQIRKSPERIVKAFLEAKRECPNIVLYLHTDMDGVFNLKQIARDCGAQNGDLVMKRQGASYDRGKMPVVFNALDCLANVSMQEGLSWTPLEAMGCGVPVIASDTTAQSELLRGVAPMVPCTELAFVPMMGDKEAVSMESRACGVSAIRETMINVVRNPDLQNDMREKGQDRFREWCAGVSNINELLTDAVKKPKPVPKIKAVLFAQHSSAGDVLMTTQCLKWLKERHPDLPLVYMTQRAFAGIVENNRYIDEVIAWDERLLSRYAVVYNPHGDHILHGGFNTLDVPLYSMYPYFCGVEPDDIWMDCVKPNVDLPGEYIVAHTTGGSKQYRTYPHLDVALKNIGLPVVQLGGPSDLRCKSDMDLCGKLSFRESAWVMKHAKAAVVVDSFLSHLAGAVGTNAVVIYGPAPPRVVGPKAQGCKIVNLMPDMLKVCKSMGHCWGRNPQCDSPCIHTINPLAVKKALEGLLQ